MSNVDKTLFVKKSNNDLIVVQVHVGDIIFASSNNILCEEFAIKLQNELEMSMMDELNYYLPLKIRQLYDGNFVPRSRYSKDTLKKFILKDVKSLDTPMTTNIKPFSDVEGNDYNEKNVVL